MQPRSRYVIRKQTEALSCIVFLIGVACLFGGWIGAVFGLPICILALAIGHRKQRSWKCPGCGYGFDEAN